MRKFLVVTLMVVILVTGCATTASTNSVYKTEPVETSFVMDLAISAFSMCVAYALIEESQR